jgi:hypothetical protein
VTDIVTQNQYIDMADDGAALGRTAGSWGASMNTLMDIFSHVDSQYIVEDADSVANIRFQQALNGEDSDFMYIEFGNQEQSYEYTLFDSAENIVQDVDRYWFIKSLMKKDYNRDRVVVISWTDESGITHSVNCRMERGKLLIPLGGCRGWLLNKHWNITVSVKQGEQVIETPEIIEIKMLKLREVE